jgi:TatD DNase family protein
MFSSTKSREQIATMPIDRVLTESDGPFTQQEGLPLYPWDVARAIEALARVWNKTATEASTVLQQNLKTLGSFAQEKANL